MPSHPLPVPPADDAQAQGPQAVPGAQAYAPPRILWEQPYVALARTSGDMEGCYDPELGDC